MCLQPRTGGTLATWKPYVHIAPVTNTHRRWTLVRIAVTLAALAYLAATVDFAAFVVLYGTVGVPKSIAVAGSLAMFSCHVLVALLGGVLTLFGPIALPSPGSSTLASPPS